MDNLFIFMIIMSKFAVPKAYHAAQALLVGILLALVLRGSSSRSVRPRSSTSVDLLPLRRLPDLYTLVLYREEDEDDDDCDQVPRIVAWAATCPTPKECHGARSG